MNFRVFILAICAGMEIAGCISFKSPKTTLIHYHGPADFKPFIRQFEADSLIYGNFGTVVVIDVTAGFGVLPAPEVGECNVDQRQITIDTHSWENMTETQKGVLIYHELGHCVLARGHLEEIFIDGTPRSIMFPILVKDHVFIRYKNYYIKELFMGPKNESGVTLNRRLF